MSIAIAIALALIIGWACLRFLPAGAEGRMPLPYLIAFIHFLWIPSALCGVLAAAQGYWHLAVLAVVLAVIIAAFDLPYYRHTLRMLRRNAQPEDSAQHDLQQSSQHTSDAAQRTPYEFSVMTLNCRYGRADARMIVEAVRSRAIAVLSLQEMSENLLNHLAAAGLNQLLPHHQIGTMRDTDNGGFNGIWTNLPVTAAIADTVDIPAAAVPSLVVAVPQQCAADSRTILCASAHPKSPMRGCAQWSRGIIGLAGVNSNTRAASTIVMGDLNANLHHPSFRALLRSGLRDATLSQGTGRIPTFPIWSPWPRLELDHIVFSNGLEARAVESFAIPGSDHLALAATLSVTR
ncbi:MAG: endonuclease/exonuclease/phosphatase family protein [Bifidobacterium tibiigranuli]|jgi:endonuclease/exonuclease/phosphatase family metal-dependent hydrolase|nr:endonuclease/exonuclease/phosphatase family protein [Bifidobacterium tibiigranuli]